MSCPVRGLRVVLARRRTMYGRAYEDRVDWRHLFRILHFTGCVNVLRRVAYTFGYELKNQ